MVLEYVYVLAYWSTIWTVPAAIASYCPRYHGIQYCSIGVVHLITVRKKPRFEVFFEVFVRGFQKNLERNLDREKNLKRIRENSPKPRTENLERESQHQTEIK